MRCAGGCTHLLALFRLSCEDECDRSKAIAAQAAIIVGQASRSSRAVSAALLGDGDRDAAQDELRTYMLMLLVGAPILIDAPVSRELLELAQTLGGEMARALLATRTANATSGAKTQPSPLTLTAAIDDAFGRLRAASAPVLRVLDLEELIAAGDTQTGDTQTGDTQNGDQADVSGDVHT